MASSSEGSAAYEDFTNTLKTLGLVEIIFVNGTMQGDQTEGSILNGLALLSQLNLDLVVICRGGGSKVDLFWLDNEAIAEAIADYPIQVWTGIGHEIDTSVLDHVSPKLKPTAIAEELVSLYTGIQQWIEQSRHHLNSTWQHRLKEERQVLDIQSQNLEHLSTVFKDQRRPQTLYGTIECSRGHSSI